jgi:hypothetical protein
MTLALPTALLTAYLALLFPADSGADAASKRATAVLDESKPAKEREALARDRSVPSSDLVAAMTRDLIPGTKEEYARIPWIWRVAIDAAKRNDVDEIRRILEVSLPAPNGRLDDWRAVVIGGGLINGITQAGDWPGPRIETALKRDAVLSLRYERALDLASAMADDPKVPTGTRYDALRMLGATTWDRRSAQLLRYLKKETHPELQMGAVSGLGDLRDHSSDVAKALIEVLGDLDATNRSLALQALTRDEARAQRLLDAIAADRVKAVGLGEKTTEALKTHASDAVRARALELLGKP